MIYVVTIPVIHGVHVASIHPIVHHINLANIAHIAIHVALFAYQKFVFATFATEDIGNAAIIKQSENVRDQKPTKNN